VSSVYMWARPHPKGASICSTDGVGAVNNAAWADDLLFVSGKFLSCHSMIVLI
jgi:hypothetical protein